MSQIELRPGLADVPVAESGVSFIDGKRARLEYRGIAVETLARESSFEETTYLLLKGDLHESAFSFDSDVLADGKYYFRVVASDREVNPPASAREGDLTSSPVMIDNTPPIVTVGQVRHSGATAEIAFEAKDAASPLRRCEYSVDATGWVPLEAADGVIDSQQEKFVLSLDKLSPGEHLVVIRVLDSANNAGLAKVVLP